MASPKKVVILGATGSIGTSALRVIRGHREHLQLVGIAGNSESEKLAQVAREFEVEHVVLYDPQACESARTADLFSPDTDLRSGRDGLIHLATLTAADIILVAIVGIQALHPTLAALEAGKDIALASKEILVLAGQCITDAARRNQASILPADSEHNAIFQCLEGNRSAQIDKLILTASGGRFRDYSLEQMKEIQPQDAIQHPNWSMGPKVTVDSATMANKGLELIEAHWLFSMEPTQIEIVVHPQSIVHSMVQFVDGSILAQLSPPSMTFAIQHTLLYPKRFKGIHESLDFSKLLTLEFSPPDVQKFPCLRLARETLEAGGVAPALFNAANEVAVTAFLENRIAFLDIPKIIAKTLADSSNSSPNTLDEILQADADARKIAAKAIESNRY